MEDNTQIISFPTVATQQQTVAAHSSTPRQHIQQQPTYILVPAAQLASGTENHVYASTPIRSVTTGHKILRNPGLTINTNSTKNTNTLNLGSSDRSIILLQQPVGGSGIHLGSTNTIVSGSGGAGGGGTTLVPLRPLNVSGGGNGLVSSGGTTLVSTASNRLIGSNVGVDLFSNNNSVGSRSSQSQSSSVGLVTISANAAASGSSSSGTPQVLLSLVFI
ncbi:unnamed protein product [Trichobilharzia regenti]|nr:unnamed protein product [Trichobilharzia regenti]